MQLELKIQILKNQIIQERVDDLDKIIIWLFNNYLIDNNFNINIIGNGLFFVELTLIDLTFAFYNLDNKILNTEQTQLILKKIELYKLKMISESSIKH